MKSQIFEIYFKVALRGSQKVVAHTQETNCSRQRTLAPEITKECGRTLWAHGTALST